LKNCFNKKTERWRACARHFFWLAVIGCCGAACADSPAELVQNEPPAKAIFIGNSFTYYNNSLHNHYRRLVTSSGFQFDEEPVTRIMTISGGHLPEHQGGMPVMLASEDWGVVVMQGHSLGPISEATAGPFREAAREYATLIRESGARPVFFMTWAYTGKPEMTQLLDAAYTSIGRELGAEVVPVGLAFAAVTKDRPNIKLRVPDARHPTVAGTYLAACSFYAAFFNRSPEGLRYTAGLDSEVAAYLQRIAWETNSKYRNREAMAQVAAPAVQ
jgi:hypothetical protein